MKVRIEIEIGDKFIGEEHVIPDDVLVLSRFPSNVIGDIERELWSRMAPAREKAITELINARRAKMVREEWS